MIPVFDNLFSGQNLYEQTVMPVCREFGLTYMEFTVLMFLQNNPQYDTAAQIVYCSPCKYGLYRTTVGDDVQKNDMFENLISHGEQARIEEEARMEAERQQAEEQARIEAEEQARREAEEASIAAEEAARQAEEAARQAELKAAQEEAARLAEQERLRAEEETRQKEAQQQKLIFSILGIVAVIALIAIVSALYRKMTGGKFSKSNRAKK